MAKTKSESKKRNELIYVMVGKEKTLVDTESEKLVEKLLEPEQRATGFFNADPAEVAATEVLDELRTLPFLTEKRVVLIKSADDFVSENRELLEKYFDNPSPTGILVLTVSSWSAQTKLAKKLPSVGQLLIVSQPKRAQLSRRIMQYSRDAHGKTIGEAAAELLVELTGDELVRLYSEVDKLALFAQNERTITEQHIESLIGHNRIFNAFMVIDAVIAGDISQAICRLRKMFTEDKTAEYTAIGAFAFYFRRMFGAKVLLEKGVSTSEIAKGLRMWGDREKSFFAQLRKMTLKQIGAILQQLAATDYAIKTGQVKAEAAIERLVLGLAEE
jgi:DNA polymerase-3 subunit delta